MKVVTLIDYRLRLWFDDGVEGEVAPSHLAGKGVFAVWADRRELERVAIGSSGELKWGDQIDLCPDAIYLRMTGKTPEDLFPRLKAIARNA